MANSNDIDLKNISDAMATAQKIHTELLNIATMCKHYHDVIKDLAKNDFANSEFIIFMLHELEYIHDDNVAKKLKDLTQICDEIFKTYTAMLELDNQAASKYKIRIPNSEHFKLNSEIEPKNK